MLRAVRWRSGSVLVLPLVLTGMSVAVSGCHNALSSQGTPRSNYQAAKQATQPGQPAPAKPGKPQPPTTPVTPTKPVPPTTPPVDPSQESLTLLIPSEVQNEDAGKTPSYDGRTLEITFQDEVTLTSSEVVDDSEHSYIANIEDKTAKKPVPCIVHYTLNESAGVFKIAKGTPYTFTRNIDVESSVDPKTNNRSIFLTRVSGGHKAGRITEITCEGHLDSDTDTVTPSVEDLINAFGGPTLVQASIQMQAAPTPTSKPKPVAATAPAQSMSRTPQSVTSDSTNDSNNDPQISGKSTVKKSVLVEHDDSILNARPNFAFQLEGSMNAFGGSTISPAEQGVTSKAALIEAEYQPSFLQGFGTLGIGPSIGMYPTTGGVVGTGQQVVNGPTSIWEVGAQVRYQFRYVTEQMIVPFVGYNYQRLHYNINQGGGNSGLNIAGGSAGLSILLNRLDETAASDLYRNTGISRLYLVTELKNLQGSDDNVAIAGNSFFFGIRCEL
jgi:hypothetical protein